MPEGSDFHEEAIGTKVADVAERLVLTASDLEAMLANIKVMSASVGQMIQQLRTEDYSLELSIITNIEKWLDFHHLSPISFNKVHEYTSDYPYNDLKSFKVWNKEDNKNNMVNSLSFDFGQGLDEVHDLDWDCEGLELTTPLSPASDSSAFTNGSKTILSTLDTNSCHNTDSSETKVKSKHPSNGGGEMRVLDYFTYEGVYEEAMEISLEMEEQYYSEDEDCVQVLERLSYSTLQLDKINFQEELKLPSPSDSHYNYKLVNIDDDTQSTCSGVLSS